MITEQLKAQAIAKLRHAVPIEDIASALNIPVKLVKEWKGKLDPKDLVAIEANIYAAEKLAYGEIVTEDDNEKILKETLELTAIDIAKEVNNGFSLQDPMAAKSVQLCADAISKLYNTFILKNGSGTPMNNIPQEASTFQRLMRD